MKKYLYTLAAGLSGLLLFSGVAAADTVSVNFENPPYTLGNINAQDGWSALGSAGSGCASYDEGVAGSLGTAGFGLQSFRISDAVTSGCFGDQAFSRSLSNEAGETSAQNGGLSGGTRQNHYEASFDIASAVPGSLQPGLHISVSPDRGDGARMSYLRFEDQTDGIHVHFADYQDVAPFGSLTVPSDGCGAGDDFTDSDIATLNRSTPHTIKFVIDFVDGPNNDVVKIYVDGVLVHTGTTWEDYFRWCTESGGGVVNDAAADASRTVDSMLFRAGGDAVPGDLNNGFLVDNLSLTSGPTPLAHVHVTIAKYIDGVHATAINANSESFLQQATYSFSNEAFPGGASGSDPYSIGPVGNNTATAYEAQTLEFFPGASYSTAENTSSANVGADCSSGKEFALVGYSVGANEVDAQAAPVSLVPPSFANLQSNQFVIVRNKTCTSIPTIISPANNSCVTSANQQLIDWTDSTGVAPIMYQYQAYADAAYTNLVYDSGMTLSSSQIPTPGTPDATYYIRVRAQGANGSISDWSNGPGNPYKIIVSDTFTWQLLSPVNIAGKTFNTGSTIPIKVQITNVCGVGINIGIPSLTITGPTTSSGPFRFDASAGQYIFNWMTTKGKAGLYTITVGQGLTGLPAPYPTIAVTLVK